MTRSDASFGRLCAAWAPMPNVAPAASGSRNDKSDDAIEAYPDWIHSAPSHPHVHAPAVHWVMVASRTSRAPGLLECGLLDSVHDTERKYRIEPVAVDSLDQLERRCHCHAPRLLIIDLAFAIDAGADDLHRFKCRVAASDLLVGSFAPINETLVPFLRHARGCIDWRWSLDELLSAFDAVIDGELWFPKPLMQALYLSLLSELDKAEQQPIRASAMDDNALTLRESEVLALMRQGLTNREIGERLGISVNTVKKHLVHVFEKCSLRGRRQALDG